MKADGIRARNRAAIESEILAVASEHLAEHGAAALSLRAIARDLGMASSAVYRYVASRDDLLTALIVAAYTSLGDAVDGALAADDATHAAEAESSAQQSERQFRTLGRAMRSWALAHPHDYALLYGSPVPHYDAPGERTIEPGTRVQLRLVGILTAMAPERASGWPSRGLLGADMLSLAPLHETTMVRGLLAWTLLVGSVSAEIFQQFGADTIADREGYFEEVLSQAIAVARE